MSDCREEDASIVLKPIGIARTPYRIAHDAPFQGRFSDALSRVSVFDRYSHGLKDVETCSHLYVLYWADQADRDTLQTLTPWGPELRGVFACRSPARPNTINLCVVELVEREGNDLVVRGLDALDGSLVLDIKPYSTDIDAVANASIGWFAPR